MSDPNAWLWNEAERLTAKREAANVQAWADGFGNWHALVMGDMPNAGTLAYDGIKTELETRQGEPLDLERFTVRQIAYTSPSTTEWVEHWQDESYVIRPDTATCGTCGKTFPDIYPSARCPYEYDHESESDNG